MDSAPSSGAGQPELEPNVSQVGVGSEIPAALIMDELAEAACDFRVDGEPLASETAFENVRAQLTANELRAVVSENADRLLGFYIDREAVRFVIVVDPGHFEWARTALPWLIEGSLRVSTIPIVVQPACADLPRLRALRDAVLRDPTLREAITTSRRSNGVGFSIDTEAMRLRMFLEESLASPKLVEHLENTFGVDNLDVGTITLLPGDPG